MIGKSRRSLLKAGAALTGAYAIGFPAIVRAQSDKIRIGHLTPLTGFLDREKLALALPARRLVDTVLANLREHVAPTTTLKAFTPPKDELTDNCQLANTAV